MYPYMHMIESCVVELSWGRGGGGFPDFLTVNVLGLVSADLAVREFTVGRLGSAVTAGKIVDNETENV